MRRKFADVIANQKRGLRSIGRDRSPNISPRGRIVDYEQGKGGRDPSGLRNPFSRYQTNPREEFISRFDGGYPIDNRIIETNLMPDTQKDDMKSILDFLRATEDQGKQYEPTLPDESGPEIMPIPRDLGGAEGDFIGNTGYFNEPYFEMGSGIEYQPPSGGTRYTGVPFGDADYNLGRVYPDPNEVNRPVEKRQFLVPDPSEDRNFFMEPGYEPSRVTTPFIPPDYEISPMEPFYDDGAYDTTRGDLGYAAGLDAFNKYNMYNPRQEGLDYTPPTQPRPSWDNSVGNYLRKIAAGARLFNRGGIASLRR